MGVKILGRTGQTPVKYEPNTSEIPCCRVRIDCRLCAASLRMKKAHEWRFWPFSVVRTRSRDHEKNKDKMGLFQRPLGTECQKWIESRKWACLGIEKWASRKRTGTIWISAIEWWKIVIALALMVENRSEIRSVMHGGWTRKMNTYDTISFEKGSRRPREVVRILTKK